MLPDRSNRLGPTVQQCRCRGRVIEIEGIYLLPGLMLCAVLVLCFIGAATIDTGWFSAKRGTEEVIYIGTLEYTFAHHKGWLPLQGPIKSAGIAALALTLAGDLLAVIACMATLFSGFVHKKNPSRSYTASVAWISCFVASVCYTAAWTEYLAVITLQWNRYFTPEAPENGYSLIFTAVAGSVSAMAGGLIMWSQYGRIDFDFLVDESEPFSARRLSDYRLHPRALQSSNRALYQSSNKDLDHLLSPSPSGEDEPLDLHSSSSSPLLPEQ